MVFYWRRRRIQNEEVDVHYQIKHNSTSLISVKNSVWVDWSTKEWQEELWGWFNESRSSRLYRVVYKALGARTKELPENFVAPIFEHLRRRSIFFSYIIFYGIWTLKFWIFSQFCCPRISSKCGWRTFLIRLLKFHTDPSGITVVRRTPIIPAGTHFPLLVSSYRIREWKFLEKTKNYVHLQHITATPDGSLL